MKSTKATNTKATKEPSKAAKEATRATKTRTWSRVGLAVALAAAVLGAAGYWQLRARPVEVGGVDLGSLPRGLDPSRLNLLLITLDTTRADRLGVYGEPTRVTPAMDRL